MEHNGYEQQLYTEQRHTILGHCINCDRSSEDTEMEELSNFDLICLDCLYQQQSVEDDIHLYEDQCNNVGF